MNVIFMMDEISSLSLSWSLEPNRAELMVLMPEENPTKKFTATDIGSAAVPAAARARAPAKWPTTAQSATLYISWMIWLRSIGQV